VTNGVKQYAARRWRNAANAGICLRAVAAAAGAYAGAAVALVRRGDNTRKRAIAPWANIKQLERCLFRRQPARRGSSGSIHAMAVRSASWMKGAPWRRLMSYLANNGGKTAARKQTAWRAISITPALYP